MIDRSWRSAKVAPVVISLRKRPSLPLPPRRKTVSRVTFRFPPIARDIVAYIDQPPEARKPVGYQRDFLDAYQPNVTRYLSESLRRELHNMGKTAQADAPAGTYSRAILNRLLIDWHRVILRATPIPASTPGS